MGVVITPVVSAIRGKTAGKDHASGMSARAKIEATVATNCHNSRGAESGSCGAQMAPIAARTSWLRPTAWWRRDSSCCSSTALAHACDGAVHLRASSS